MSLPPSSNLSKVIPDRGEAAELHAFTMTAEVAGENKLVRPCSTGGLMIGAIDLPCAAIPTRRPGIGADVGARTFGDAVWAQRSMGAVQAWAAAR